MKVKPIVIAAILLACAATCSAQSIKVAVIDTDMFTNPKKGITRLVNAINLVDREVAPGRAELLEMYDRLQEQRAKLAFAGPIPTDPTLMTAERKQRIKDATEKMQHDFELKQQEIDLAYNRRIKEVTAPINEDIRRSLEAFTKAHGITILIDISKRAGPIIENEEELENITIGFITEYNRQHQ